jgi:hypothetical protein
MSLMNALFVARFLVAKDYRKNWKDKLALAAMKWE